MLQTIEKVGLRWLLRFRKLDMTQPEQRQALVDTFINAIYLYDDKVLITFNYKEGTETVAFGEAVKAEKSSDMSARGAPEKPHSSVEKRDVWLFLCQMASLTTFCGVLRFAGKILVQFIGDMERIFLFQMGINIGGDLNAAVSH